jgi:integrase
MAAYQAAISGKVVASGRRQADGTLGRLVADFYGSAEFANLAASSQATYRFALAPIVAADGHRLVRDLTHTKARKVIQEIGASERRGFANLTRAVLRRLFGYAISMGMRPDNPFDGIPVYKLGTIHTWTDEELAAYEARWPHGTRERLAYDVLLYTAQRISDAVRIPLADAMRGTITLEQQKTGEEVALSVHPALMRSIKAGPCNGVSLLGKASGQPMRAKALGDLISRAARDAGVLPRCVAHGLRKAGLRRLAEGGASSKQIQAVSGHRTLQQVERYTERADRGHMARAAIALWPDRK